MERWAGRVALVTGASAGIGAGIAYQLQDAGLDVIAVARRDDKIAGAVEAARRDAEARGRVPLGRAAAAGRLHCMRCDVSREEDILAVFRWARDNWGAVHVLINNAGIVVENKLYEASTEELKRILDINVMGLSICTREAIKLMREKGIDDGQIIHIGSICAHMQPMGFPGAMYYASKHAVRVLLEGLRKELVAAQSRIRVMEISPGSVKSEILDNMKIVTAEMRFKDPFLWAEDIADIVLYTLSTPAHVQIHDVIVMPTGEVM